MFPDIQKSIESYKPELSKTSQCVAKRGWFSLDEEIASFMKYEEYIG